MKLLFHCCCGPCASACIDALAAENITVRLFWFNPNIHPFCEYKSRRDSLVQFAASQKLELETVDEYGLRPFLGGLYAGADNISIEALGRCTYCYRIRLEKTAAAAAQMGFDAFSTSLLASPWQNHEAIRRIGGELAARHGLSFFYHDFRSGFRQGQERARASGLYMQKYCGCIFSEEERYAKKPGAKIAQKTAACP
jgi:predicted adenine nucleotide alpha hydrolase (AANH) superfamily ATPase